MRSKFTILIASSEKITGIKKDIIEFASILHDIGIKEAERKYNSAAGNYQEMESPPIARKILEENNISNKIIERVCFIIGNHHSYQKIDDEDFQILVEADFIVNIFEDNLSKNSLDSIYKKYFKTTSGKELMMLMYSSES